MAICAQIELVAEAGEVKENRGQQPTLFPAPK